MLPHPDPYSLLLVPLTGQRTIKSLPLLGEGQDGVYQTELAKALERDS
jgi:hypothetical protein